MSKIDIQKISIVDLTTDAIVNAANEGLWAGGGVCGAIFRAAGLNELQKACDKLGHCDTGSAVITPGFNLKSQYIIHAVGPRWKDGKHGEPDKLYGAYYKSLELAAENGCTSIGFPLISAGIFGYPVKAAWYQALKACRDFLEKNPEKQMDIVFAVLDDKGVELGKKVLAQSEGVENKEAGKPVLDLHRERIKVFEDTQNWIKEDPVLSHSVSVAKLNTKVYYEDDYPAFNRPEVDEEIAVTGYRSYEAAMKLSADYPGCRIAVMNFANAFHAGGGVTKGAGAQEECLCRTSTLYPLLYRKSLRDTFYKHHHDRNTPKATDSLIYTQGVVICKTDEEIPQRMPAEDWVTVDVITIAAPDLREKSNPYAPLVGNGTYMNNAELFGYHVKRAIHLLTVAAAREADILVLGAFGCGAFQNDPDVVARAYKTALQEFPKVFKRVEFAVYCPPGGSRNYTAFRQVLEGQE